jgi:beta-glucosidase
MTQETTPAGARGASPFPKDFLFAAASAAHQVEGNNINTDFWVMETTPGGFFAEPSGDALDHYHRYEEDIRTLKELGFNSFRTSVEWARVEPEDGMFSEAEIGHYRRVLECCHENGLTPMVTIMHFTSPRWLMQLGGWESPEVVGRLARFAERVARDLGDLIPYYCTINEANMRDWLKLMGSEAGDADVQAPVGVDVSAMRGMRESQWWTDCARRMGVTADKLNPFFFAASDATKKNICEAHAAVREAIKRVQPDAKVGITLSLIDIQLRGGDPKAAEQLWDTFLYSYKPYMEGDDFIGVQNYMRYVLGPDGPLPPELERTEMGYEFYPEALEGVCREASKLGLPLIVTESGYAGDDDTRRVEFIDRALKGIERCLSDGIDVRGYVYWCALDNFEWLYGYRPKFGLISVDRTTQKRTPKPSAKHLGAIARRARGEEGGAKAGSRAA